MNFLGENGGGGVASLSPLSHPRLSLHIQDKVSRIVLRMNECEFCIETLQSHLRSIDASYRNPLETKKNHNGYLSRRHPHSVRSRFSHPGPITTLLLKINYSELYKTTVSHLIQREENWNTFIGHVQRSGPPRAICRLEAF